MKTVDWDFENIEVECDNPNCRAQYTFQFDGYPDFKACQSEIQDYGWESHKINGEWYDFCDHDCYVKYLQDELGKGQRFF